MTKKKILNEYSSIMTKDWKKDTKNVIQFNNAYDFMLKQGISPIAALAIKYNHIANHIDKMDEYERKQRETIRPFIRKRVGEDGYIIEEKWVRNYDGDIAPLNSIVTSSENGFDLFLGKEIRDEDVVDQIERHAETQRSLEKSLKSLKKTLEELNKNNDLI